MPFPAAPLTFIQHNNPHLAAGWESTFGAFGWFRLPGFIESVVDLQRAAAAANRRFSVDNIKQCRAAAIGQVPPQLQGQLPGGEWDVIAAPQIDACKKNHPMRFDKACLAAAALDVCAQQFAPATNALARVRIAPAIYQLNGFDNNLWQQIQGHAPVGTVPFVAALKQHTNQVHTNFFTELAKGYAATYRTLDLTLQFLTTHNMHAGLAIQQMTSRDYGDGHLPKERRRKKHPNRLETVVAV